MTDHLCPTDVSGRLSALLSDAFPGVQFQAVSMVAYDVATIDVAWIDGPSLHEVDLLALNFVLRAHLDSWGTPVRTKIDRISKRRTMSPPTEEMLLQVLASDLGINAADADMEQVFALPPMLVSARYCAEKGTVPEFLDLLFESTSFSAAGQYACAVEPDALRCRCAVCA